MPGDYLPDDLKNLWQELSTNPVPVSIDGLRGEMGKLRKRATPSVCHWRRRRVVYRRELGAVFFHLSQFPAANWVGHDSRGIWLYCLADRVETIPDAGSLRYRMPSVLPGGIGAAARLSSRLVVLVASRDFFARPIGFLRRSCAGSSGTGKLHLARCVSHRHPDDHCRAVESPTGATVSESDRGAGSSPEGRPVTFMGSGRARPTTVTRCESFSGNGQKGGVSRQVP